MNGVLDLIANNKNKTARFTFIPLEVLSTIASSGCQRRAALAVMERFF